MRLANLGGRLHLVDAGGAIDVAKVSDGLFDSSPQAVFDRWDEFTAWVGRLGPDVERTTLEQADLGAPVPEPCQVFAVALNYAAHADESGFVKPDAPLVFTKFPSSITGPRTTVALPTETVDWEVELVVVIGRTSRRVSVTEAWDHVAGLCVGQDISERTSQHAGPVPQFSLAKSFPGFSPLGGELVTPDELVDRDDLKISCAIDGVEVQHGRTGQMIFPVAELVSYLSTVVTLKPGDLIFTGTPAGVGAGRIPPRYLREGEVLTSSIEGLGKLEQTFVAEGR